MSTRDDSECGDTAGDEEYETYTDEDASDPEWDFPPESELRRSSRNKQKEGAARYGKKGRLRLPPSASDARQRLGDSYNSLLALLQSQAQVTGQCGRPQASYATNDSITLTWRIPADAIGKELFTYRVQYCKVDRPTSTQPPPQSGEEDRWQDIPNPVEGLGHDLGYLHTCSWVVTGLPTKKWVSFRVQVSNCAAYASWSMPSQAFQIGASNYSPVGSGVGGDTWTEEELALFRTLDTPMKVQDYLDSIPMNQEVDADVSLSALECVRQNHAHCLEGALLGAYILGMHGYGTLLMDLRSSPQDDDHVITPFQWKGRWGCLSVSNHSSLR
jgi:hypothetical protein